ncbi:MAG: SufE family protein [Phycisphaeraceae bacterium]
MPTLNELTTDELISTFRGLEGWEDRFEYILDLAKQVPELDESERTDETRLTGCVSQVWVKTAVTQDDPPRFEFVANSDAAIVTGLIAVLMVVYNGRPVDEVADADPLAVLREMDLETHLSPTRRNGLHAMVERIRGDAGAPGVRS